MTFRTLPFDIRPAFAFLVLFDLALQLCDIDDAVLGTT